MPGTNDGAQAPNGTGAPAAEGTPAPAAPPPAAAAPPPPAEPTISMPSAAFKSRLDEERSKGAAKLLKDLGFEKPEDAQAALKALKAREDADLSEKQRLEKRVKELEALEPKAKAYEAQLTAIVEEQFAALPENIQKAIDDVAGGVATERARVMKTFRAHGLIGGPAAPAAPKPPGPANPPGPNSPPPPPAVATNTKFHEWQEKAKSSRVAGAIFYRDHHAEIEASRPADQ